MALPSVVTRTFCTCRSEKAELSAAVGTGATEDGFSWRWESSEGMHTLEMQSPLWHSPLLWHTPPTAVNVDCEEATDATEAADDTAGIPPTQALLTQLPLRHCSLLPQAAPAASGVAPWQMPERQREERHCSLVMQASPSGSSSAAGATEAAADEEEREDEATLITETLLVCAAPGSSWAKTIWSAPGSRLMRCSSSSSLPVTTLVCPPVCTSKKFTTVPPGVVLRTVNWTRATKI